MNALIASDNGVFRSCDRYLNSGANLLKLTEVVCLYVVLSDPCAFIVLSFIQFVTSTLGRLKDSINSNKFNKGSLEFHNDRFVYNYESSLLEFFNPILDGVRTHPILDGGGKKAPLLTLPVSV